MWKFLRQYTAKVIVGGCVTVTFCDILGHPSSVNGNSMQPTLNGSDSRWWKRDIVWQTAYGIKWGGKGPNKGDIVTFTPPREPQKRHIKRVAASEGEMVRPKNRDVLMIIPIGTYWMESDNPVNANDSNVYGPVSHGLIHGRATHIIWPPSRWQRL